MEFIRNLDHLDRVVLPCDIRKAMEVKEDTRLALSFEIGTGRITLKKAVGGENVTRRVDELGRVYLSKEMRVQLGIGERSSLHMTCDGEKITLTAVEPKCRLCGKPADTNRLFPLCEDCMNHIKAW